MTPLPDIFAVRPDDTAVLLAIVLWTAALYASSLIRPDLFMEGLEPDLTPDRTRAYAWFYHRVCGAMFFGAAAWLGTRVIEIDAASFGFTWGRFDRTIASVVAIAIVTAPLLVAYSRRPTYRTVYPEIRIRRWSGRMLSNNRTTWMLYLGAYEAMLRGVCLFTLAAWASPAIAVLVTSALDIAAHAKRPAAEVALRLPLAIALGTAALWSGSILGPWVSHVLVVIAAESLGRPATAPRRSA